MQLMIQRLVHTGRKLNPSGFFPVDYRKALKMPEKISDIGTVPLRIRVLG